MADTPSGMTLSQRAQCLVGMAAFIARGCLTLNFDVVRDWVRAKQLPGAVSMWRMIMLATLVVCTACGPVKQSESHQIVAAYEIPLPTEQDRSEFLALLSREAEAEGLHVDAANPEDLSRMAAAIPVAAKTIRAAVWRGSRDDRLEASIMDGHDHPGQIWIMFLKGEDPALADRFRERVMLKITARWPDTLSLPIMPTGTIPLHRDLRKTPDGYEVDPEVAWRYEPSP